MGKVSQNEAVKIISMLDTGINTKKLDMEAEITRINFLIYALNMTGVRLQENVKKPVFKDIPPSTEAATYTKYAKENGIIAGYEDGTYRPEKGITYIEAVKILLTILNYTDYANNMGGYPNGYKALSADINLDAGIEKAYDSEFLTNGDVMILLVNLLGAPIISLSLDNGRISYGFSEDETVASLYYDCTVEEGIVDGVTGTSFDGELNIRDNAISIDQNVYTCNFDAYNFLGHRVKAYVNTDGECIGAVAYKNNVLTINAKDLVREESTLEKIYYETDKNKKYSYAKINTLADLVYNKKGFPEYTIKQMLPETGKITLIDNNNDEIYDVIIVDEYDVIWVNYVDTVTNTIFNQYKKGTAFPELVLKDAEYTLTYNSNEYMLSALKKDDIVLVYKSASDDESYILELVRNTVAGKIKALDYAENEITLDDELYNFSPVYMDIKTADDDKVRDISLGEDVTVYLDKYNEIVAVVKTELGNNRYAFIRKIFLDEADESVVLRLLTTEEKWESVKLKKKVKIDGTSRTALDIYSNSDISTAGKAVQQIIEYRQNSHGEIILIDTAKANSNDYDEFRKKTIKQIYRSANRSFDSIYHIDKECYIFVVPQADATGDKTIDETIYAVYKNGYFEDWEEYTVDLYNYDKFGYSPLCCLRVNSGDIGKFTANSFIFSDTSTIVEGDNVYKTVLGAIGANSKVVVKVAENISTDNFKKGGIYNLKLNINNEIYEYTPVVKPEQIGTQMSAIAPGSLHNGATIMGNIVDAEPSDGKLLIDDGYKVGGEPQYKSILIDDTSLLYTIDMKNRKSAISVGKATDIAIGDYVVISYSNSIPSRIVVYK